MKFSLLLSLLLVFMNAACSSDEPTCTSTKHHTCSDAGSFKTCVDGDDTWYTWNGKEYHCDDGDCSSAAQQMAADVQEFCD